MAKKKHLMEWTGSDGKKYVTDDPEFVRRQIAARMLRMPQTEEEAEEVKIAKF